MSLAEEKGPSSTGTGREVGDMGAVSDPGPLSLEPVTRAHPATGAGGGVSASQRESQAAGHPRGSGQDMNRVWFGRLTALGAGSGGVGSVLFSEAGGMMICR